MARTAYSRNPSTAKGICLLTQWPEHPARTSEFIIRTLMRQPKQSRA